MTLTTSQNPHSVPHPHRGSEALYYCSHTLHSKKYIGSLFSAFLKRLNQFVFHVNIPPQVKIGKRLELAHGGFGVVIHQNTIIGDDAIIFHNVTIGNGGARIGNRVYIGTGVVIIGAVKIGDDVSIGANTVINFDVPAGATVVGTRAKIITAEEKEQKRKDDHMLC